MVKNPNSPSLYHAHTNVEPLREEYFEKELKLRLKIEDAYKLSF